MRDKAARYGETVPERDQRKRTTSYSLAKQVKLRGNPFSQSHQMQQLQVVRDTPSGKGGSGGKVGGGRLTK